MSNLSIYIFPSFSNSMRILILLAAFFLVATSFNFVTAQTVTNSTPVLVLPPAQQQQTTDPIGLASIIVTSVVVPVVGAFLYKKDSKTKEVAKDLHGENEFRLEASTEALKEMNNSLKATDQGNLEFYKIVQALFKPFKENETLKKAYENYTVDGTPVLQALDEYIEDAQTDLIEYYNGENTKEDKFDTCNDPIVQKLALVRNKSKK